MMTIQALDAAFLLVVVAHMVIMLNRRETPTWEHTFGRVCLVAIGVLAAKLALTALSQPTPHNLEFWTRFGFDAALATFIVLRVWWPRATTNLHTIQH